jgi:homopolymeric O-antigen transport system permease protein
MQRTQSLRTVAAGGRPRGLGTVIDGVREVWSRRRLAGYLVQADMAKKGSDSFLGNIWWVLDPLLQMLVYVVLVSVIFQRKIEAYPLFIFAAILPWKWFASSVGDAITSVSSRERIIKQVKFPTLVLPVAAVVAGIVNFAFGLIPLFGMMLLLFPSHISAWLLLIPVIAASQFVFTLAVAIVLGSVNVFYRDIGNVVGHLLRLWFYLSPGLYGAAQVASLTDNHTVLRWLFAANPFTTYFESYRAVIYDGQPPAWLGLAIWTLISVVLTGVAIVIFKRLEPSFAKVL